MKKKGKINMIDLTLVVIDACKEYDDLIKLIFTSKKDDDIHEEVLNSIRKINILKEKANDLKSFYLKQIKNIQNKKVVS